jgi:hypothetical protein
LQISCMFSVSLLFGPGSDGWIGSGAPIFPMKGPFAGLVQLLVHGSHYPISSPGGFIRETQRNEWPGVWLEIGFVACMTEELHRPLACRSLD